MSDDSKSHDDSKSNTSDSTNPTKGGAEAVPDPTGIPEGEDSKDWGGAEGGAKPGEKPVTGIDDGKS